MAVQVQDSDNIDNQSSNAISPKRIVISKLVFLIIVASVILTFVALIIGLTVGLKKAYTPSETEKYETCLDLSCKNVSLLQSIFFYQFY
jgi:type III secretory pathway component EscS